MPKVKIRGCGPDGLFLGPEGPKLSTSGPLGLHSTESTERTPTNALVDMDPRRALRT